MNTEVLKFGSAFCGPCTRLDAFLAAEGYKYTDLDADVEQALVAKYGVRGVPTLIKLVDGKEVDRVIGFGHDAYEKVRGLFDV